MHQALPQSGAAGRRPSDRRRFARHACRFRGTCRLLPLDAGQGWPILTRDVSAGGVAVQLPRRFEPGTLLTVELRSDAGDTLFTYLARIVRVQGGGSNWDCGCTWATPLRDEELHDLVIPPETVSPN